jgi:quercetin dioxygenase-like cupin family protein
MRINHGLALAIALILTGGGSALGDAPDDSAAASHDAMPAKLFAKPEDAPFVATPITPPCNVLYGTRGDPSKEAATFIVKMEPGCIVSWHWHHATEEVVLLKGVAVAQMKGGKPITLHAASYSQLPAKHVHRFRCASKEPCFVFVVGDAAFDINYVSEDGKPLTSAEAIALTDKVGHAGW